MRIAVITDAHANLPALDAALAAIRADGVTAVYHTGDVIGIGPFPAEVLDRLLHEPRLRLVMGNHDAWFAFGLPRPRPSWMGEGEPAHQRWVHAQLDPALRPVVAQWPWAIAEDIEGVPVAFLHYALDETGRGFADPVPAPDSAALDRLFAPCHARLVFYGHQHYPRPVPLEIAGRARYVNPGRSAAPPSRWLGTPCWTSTTTGRAVRSGPTLRRLRGARGAGASVHHGDVLRWLKASHGGEVCGHAVVRPKSDTRGALRASC